VSVSVTCCRGGRGGRPPPPEVTVTVTVTTNKILKSSVLAADSSLVDR
jgi:hypothetical protein